MNKNEFINNTKDLVKKGTIINQKMFDDIIDNIASVMFDNKAPKSYSLDRTTTPWTIWFDNGSGIQFPDLPTDVKTNQMFYGYGFAEQPTQRTQFTLQPMVANVMRASQWAITLDYFKRFNSDSYIKNWLPSTTVINPINDKNKYNWDNAFGNAGTAANGYKRVIARVFYELGIWSDADVVSIGATLK